MIKSIFAVLLQQVDRLIAGLWSEESLGTEGQNSG